MKSSIGKSIRRLRGSAQTPESEDDFRCPGLHITSEQLSEKIKYRSEGAPFRLDGKCFHGEYLREFGLYQISAEGSCFFRTTLYVATFQGSKLKGANFHNANLTSAILTGADLSRTDLQAANLDGADLTGANLLGSNLSAASLCNAIFRDTLVSSDSFGKKILAERNRDFLDANEIYRALRKNFEEIGDYNSASWAYYRERVCKYSQYGFMQVLISLRDTQRPPTRHPLLISAFADWLKNKSCAAWFKGFFQDMLWGFAQKPERVLVCGAIIVVIFSLLYAAFHLVMDTTSNILAWYDYLLFSLAAFSTSSVPNLVGVNQLAHAIASFQGILGVTVLALFTTSLASRWGGR